MIVVIKFTLKIVLFSTTVLRKTNSVYTLFCGVVVSVSLLSVELSHPRGNEIWNRKFNNEMRQMKNKLPCNAIS
jgi:hypothetical protein